jgi:hypothetical protein
MTFSAPGTKHDMASDMKPATGMQQVTPMSVTSAVDLLISIGITFCRVELFLDSWDQRNGYQDASKICVSDVDGSPKSR